MKKLKEELGEALSSTEFAEFLGVNEKTVIKYYVELGGIRIGRLYKFFEKEVINAIQTWNQMDRTIEEEPRTERQSIQRKEGSPELGSQDANAVRRRVEREDKHGLFN